MKLTCYLRPAVLLALCVFLTARVSAHPVGGEVAMPRDSPAPPVSVASPEQQRNDAVKRARQGQYPAAIEILERLIERDPGNTGALHDLLIILGWAERDRDALLLAESLQPDSAPLGVLEALGKSARNVGDYEQSVRWYKLAISRFAGSLDSQLGLAMVLADMGQPQQALRVLGAAAIDERYRPQLLMARAYTQRGDEKFPQAIATYNEILAIDPGHRGALRGIALSLQNLLLPQQALDFIADHPGILSEDELAQLHSDRVAVQIRWAEQTAAGKPASKKIPLSDVLQEISAIRHQYADNKALQRRTQYDRIVALKSLQKMTEVVSEFERLESGAEEIPAYVLGAAAAAYSYLKQPEKALDLLQRALQQAPDSFNLKQDLFYAYVDLERHAQAMLLAEELRQSQPVWHQEPGSRVIKMNALRMRAEITAGLSLAFANQLPESQARFEDLVSRAPHNTDMRQELGSVYRSRGWTDRALFEYRQVLSVEPDLTSARVGHAHAMLDLRQYEVAEGEISALIAEMPARQDVIRLGRRWQRIKKYEFRIDSTFGESSGNQFGSQQYRVDGYFFVKPIAYRLRPFVHTSDAFAEFPEGNSFRRRLGLGLEYRGTAWSGSLEATNDRSGGQAGFNSALEWRISDFWTLGGVWQVDSDTIPLRGHRTGVTSDLAGVRVRYRASESRQVQLSGEQQKLSDGNTRTSLTLRGRQRLVARPAYKLDLSAELYASNSDPQEVTYFNPVSDESVLLTATNEWRTYRRYDFSFTQQFNVGFGYYRQDAFGTKSFGSLQYLASIEVSDGLSTRFGVRYARNIYDGLAEYGTFFNIGIAGAF